MACVYLPLRIVMKNPKFDFYAKLYTLIQNKEFKPAIAEEVFAIYSANQAEISLPDVTLENLEVWHECFYREPKEGQRMSLGESIEGIEVFEEMVEAVFEDLAPQMRSAAVRELHQDYKQMASIPDDLFIRIRRVKALDETFAAITVVTDNVEKFRLFFTDPEKFAYSGEVHYTEATEESEQALE
jgi:hypothetical protein